MGLAWNFSLTSQHPTKGKLLSLPWQHGELRLRETKWPVRGHTDTEKQRLVPKNNKSCAVREKGFQCLDPKSGTTICSSDSVTRRQHSSCPSKASRPVRPVRYPQATGGCLHFGSFKLKTIKALVSPVGRSCSPAYSSHAAQRRLESPREVLADRAESREHVARAGQPLFPKRGLESSGYPLTRRQSKSTFYQMFC